MNVDGMAMDNEPVDPARVGEPVKTFCYEDVTLVLLPNPTGIWDMLAMELNLQYTKAHHKKPKRQVIHKDFGSQELIPL